MTGQRKRVHMPAGITPAGRKVRAHCTCGWSTTPRADESRAVEALEAEHGSQDPICDLCGRDRSDSSLPHSRRYAHVRLLVDDATGDQLLVCRDDEQACRARAQQRQAEHDRAALGGQTPRPILRVIRGGRLS